MNRTLSIALLLAITGCEASSTAQGGLAADALTSDSVHTEVPGAPLYAPSREPDASTASKNLGHCAVNVGRGQGSGGKDQRCQN